MDTILQSSFHSAQEVIRMINIKLSKRELLFLSIFAIAALIFAYLSYFIFPSYLRISELNTELVQKKQIAADRDEAQKRMENLDSILANSKAQLEDMEKMIPYNVRLPELVVNIDSKISGLGMDIRSISIGEPDTANKEYDIVPVSVSMEGKYDRIIDFINYIEKNDRKFIIDSFTLAPIKRTEAMPFDIAMRTFVLKDAKAAAIPEPEDYYFFKHNNGKSYPFMENSKVINNTNKSIDDNIKDMEKNYEKLDGILDGVKGIIPGIKGIGDGQ